MQALSSTFYNFFTAFIHSMTRNVIISAFLNVIYIDCNQQKCSGNIVHNSQNYWWGKHCILHKCYDTMRILKKEDEENVKYFL